MIKRIADSIGHKLVKRDDFVDQFQRYRQTSLWLLAALWKTNHKKFLSTILSSFTGVILHAGTLSGLLFYGSLMESNSTIDLLGSTYAARDQFVFVIVLAISGLILATGSWFKYFGARSNIELCAQFAIECGKRILERPWVVMDGPLHVGLDRYPAELARLLTGVRKLARGAKPILNLATPLTTAIYAMAILLYLEPLLTLVLISIIAPSLLLQYLINYNATQNEKVLKASSQPASMEIRAIINDVTHLDPDSKGYRARLDDSFRNPSILLQIEAFIFRKIATSKSGLVSDILLAIIAVGLMVHLGSQALAGETTWVKFLTYLVFARIGLRMVGAMFAAVTSFARHYSWVRDASYVVSGTLARPPPAQSFSREIKFNKVRGPKHLRANDAVFKTDRPVLLYSTSPLTRFNLSFFSYTIGQAIGKTGQLLLQSVYFGNCSEAGKVDKLQGSSHRRQRKNTRKSDSKGAARSKPMSEYLNSDQHFYFFVNFAGSKSEERTHFLEKIKSWTGKKKFWFVCGQSISDFSDFDESNIVLLIRPDGKLMICSLNNLREHRGPIKDWLNKWSKRIQINDEDFDDDDG